MLNCPKSCSEIDKLHEAQRAQAEAETDRHMQVAMKTDHKDVKSVAMESGIQDLSEYCPHWAMKGECAANPSFMNKECPKSCASAQIPPAQSVGISTNIH